MNQRDTHSFLRDTLTNRHLRAELAAIDGLNARLALIILRVVATMWCVYAFAALSIPAVIAALATGQVTTIINAISSNFLQLVLLPAILVGQEIQARKADHQAAAEAEHRETFQREVLAALAVLSVDLEHLSERS